MRKDTCKLGKLFFTFLNIFFLPLHLLAGRAGLSTKFSIVTLENLQPGVTYNTRELVNLPLVVRNTGEDKTVVRVEVLKPQVSNFTAEGHYEPIPDLSWIKLNRYEFDINPGESTGTDVLVRVPDEDKYLNRTYQVDFHIKSVGENTVNVALMSKLRFTIASKRMAKGEMERRKKMESYGNKIEFELLPGKGNIDDLPLGREVNIEKEKNLILKLSNPNDMEFTCLLDVLQLADLELPMPSGFTGIPDLSMIKIEKRETTVPANAIRKIKMTLTIPNEENYRGKNYAFAIKATVPGALVTSNQVSMFYVTTQK